MSAPELAVVVEGWATLVGLFVVVSGGVFGAVQLRREAEARRFQSTMAVMSEIRPQEVVLAEFGVRRIPDGTSFDELAPDLFQEMLKVVTCYARLGQLAQAGRLKDSELFLNIGVATTAIALWEKIKRHVRQQAEQDGLRALVFIEYLAARAQSYLAVEGVKRFASVGRFDADLEMLKRLGQRVSGSQGSTN